MPRRKTYELIATEKRLTRLFVVGIFLFLIIFEWVFLTTRYLFERQSQYAVFENFTHEIPKNPEKRSEFSRAKPPIPNIHYVIFDGSGNILDSRIAWQKIDRIDEIIPETTANSLKAGTATEKNWLLLKKIDQEDGKTILFLSQINYGKNELFIDILRFLFLNGLILFPFWWMAKIYVRETLDPVRKNIDTMNHFVNDAGHELKTPIAILSGNLQFMRDFKEYDQKLIEENLQVINTMNDSIEWLLELTNINLPEKKNQIFLSSIIDEEVEKLLNIYNDITVQNEVPSDISIYSDKRHVSILFKNIIENAMKYNKEQGEVTISWRDGTLIVEDSGIGMNAEEISRVFDRFYRINPSHDKNGSGIGLTIVDRIVKLSNWKITIESEEWKWTIVKLKMS